MGESQRRGEFRTCKYCQCKFCRAKSYLTKNGKEQGIYCSIGCKAKWQYENLHLENNPSWKGGRFLRSDGYVAVRVGENYELEHRMVMSNHIGRPLRSDEHVHHLNEIKDDNRIENLELVGIGEHISKYHPSQRQLDKWMDCNCLNCGIIFQRKVNEVNNHPKTFCSRACFKTYGYKNTNRTCVGCGREFNGYNRKYCSKQCYHKQPKEGIKVTHTCQRCGNSFESIPCRKPKYCGRNCMAKSYVKNK